MPTERVLADFEGAWAITREIAPQTGAPAQFQGQAVWARDGDGMAYRETGTLSMPGAAPMLAERRYRWCADLSVYFEDGRFFHTVPPAGGQTRHWCDPDSYVADYDFGPWPAFVVTWTVQGPRKSYVMTSRFTRQAGP